MSAAIETSVRLRLGRADATDAEHYARLAEAAAGGGFGRLYGPRWLEALKAAYPARRERTIFLEVDGDVAGGIGFDSLQDRTAMAESATPSLRTRAVSTWRRLRGIHIEEVRDGELYLAFVAVYPAGRRRGGGTRLIEASVLEARKRGLQYLTAAVDRRNHTSLSFFQSAGFKTEDDDGPVLRVGRSIGGIRP